MRKRCRVRSVRSNTLPPCFPTALQVLYSLPMERELHSGCLYFSGVLERFHADNAHTAIHSLTQRTRSDACSRTTP